MRISLYHINERTDRLFREKTMETENQRRELGRVEPNIIVQKVVVRPVV